MGRQRNPVNDAQRANLAKPEGKTENQRLYIEALGRDEQVFGLGPAGTGKTFLAASMAAFLYLRGAVERIVVTRPAVDAGEQHGFLPGTLDRKLEPWVKPVVEIIEECVGRAQLIEMQKAGDLELAPLGYIRGRTLRNAFVILDEAQNTTARQMEMFLTRLGEGSRVVINGDIWQSDLEGRSGLVVALDMVRRHRIPASVIQFTSEDVVRSGLCKLWVEAFESDRRGVRRAA